MSTCLKHKNVISEFPSQDVTGQVSVCPSSFRSLVPQPWTPQQFADPAACCPPVSLKYLEMPFPSSHSDGLMDHLVSPSTPYPESGSLPLLANHWISQLMCLWPGFIFAVTYQVCCTSCKNYSITSAQLDLKNCYPKTLNVCFPPAPTQSGPSSCTSQITPGSGEIDVVRSSLVPTYSWEIQMWVRTQAQVCWFMNPLAPLRLFSSVRWRWKRWTPTCRASNKIAGLMVIYIQMSRASLWSFWIRQSEARTQKIPDEGNQAWPAPAQALGPTDTAVAVIAKPVLPSSRGQGQRGQTSLPKACEVA